MEKWPDIHCTDHVHLAHCYFSDPLHSRFTKPQLEYQQNGLVAALAELCTRGKALRNQRRSIRRQLERVQAALAETPSALQANDADDRTEDITEILRNVGSCRSCGTAGCNGSCWGFFGRGRLKNQHQLDRRRQQHCSHYEGQERAQIQSRRRRLGTDKADQWSLSIMLPQVIGDQREGCRVLLRKKESMQTAVDSLTPLPQDWKEQWALHIAAESGRYCVRINRIHDNSVLRDMPSDDENVLEPKLISSRSGGGSTRKSKGQREARQTRLKAQRSVELRLRAPPNAYCNLLPITTIDGKQQQIIVRQPPPVVRELETVTKGRWVNQPVLSVCEL